MSGAVKSCAAIGKHLPRRVAKVLPIWQVESCLRCGAEILHYGPGVETVLTDPARLTPRTYRPMERSR